MAMDKMCLKRDPTNRNYSIYDDDGSNVFNRELMDIKYSLYNDDGEGSNVFKRDPKKQNHSIYEDDDDRSNALERYPI